MVQDGLGGEFEWRGGLEREVGEVVGGGGEEGLDEGGGEVRVGYGEGAELEGEWGSWGGDLQRRFRSRSSENRIGRGVVLEKGARANREGG